MGSNKGAWEPEKKQQQQIEELKGHD